MEWLLTACGLIILVAIAGGSIPLMLQRTERVQHLMIAFASGVFLSAVFLHLLPEIGEMAVRNHDAAHPPPAAGSEEGHHHHHHHHPSLLWLSVLVGVLAIYLIENLAFRKAPDNGGKGDASRAQHRALGYATLFGLSVHAFTAGLGLSTGVEVESLQVTLLFSILSHKAVEGFSLGAALLLAGIGRRKTLVFVIAFALVTPAGAMSRVLLAPDMSGVGLQIFTGLAAGTFLFVALCDLLPEVFHHRHDTGLKIALLLSGIAFEWACHTLAS